MIYYNYPFTVNVAAYVLYESHELRSCIFLEAVDEI